MDVTYIAVHIWHGMTLAKFIRLTSTPDPKDLPTKFLIGDSIAFLFAMVMGYLMPVVLLFKGQSKFRKFTELKINELELTPRIKIYRLHSILLTFLVAAELSNGIANLFLGLYFPESDSFD